MNKMVNNCISRQVLICYSDPESHPFISDKEKAYLQKSLGQLERDPNMPATPWRAILTSVPMIALVCAQVNNDCFELCCYNAILYSGLDRARLGLLHHGHRFTEIHERRTSILHY